MMQQDEQLKRRLKAAGFGAALALVGAATPTAHAAPSALEAAAQKRAAAAKPADPAPQADNKKAGSTEAASFDPFAVNGAAPAAAAAAAPAPAAQSNADDEAAKRLAAREAVLAKLSSHRPSFLVQIMKVRATRRSPNTPPDFTPRRPSDPPGPPANVPPGPPTHAPPGKPAGTPGNGPNK